MIQLTTRITGIPGGVKLDAPRGYEEAFRELLEKCATKHNGYVTARLTTPFQPRTTGPHSQNNFAHGASDDIAEQLETAEKRITGAQVYDAMKRLAVKEGYPTYYEALDDTVQPMHLADASKEQADIVNRVIARFADEHGLWLTRSDDKGTYRSVGGRTREEMEKLRV